MKIDFDLLKNKKFWIYFLKDVFTAILSSVRHYWYLFSIPPFFIINHSLNMYNNQVNIHYLSATLKYGTLKAPELSKKDVQYQMTTNDDIADENFGYNVKDLTDLVTSRFISKAGMYERMTKGPSTLVEFSKARKSNLMKVSGEGSNKKELILKFKSLTDFLQGHYDKSKRFVVNHLLKRREILTDEYQILKDEIERLKQIEKEFGYTKEVGDLKSDYQRDDLDFRRRILDIDHAMEPPYIENFKVLNLSVSPVGTKPYGKGLFIFLGVLASVIINLLLFGVIVFKEYRKLPPNLIFLTDKAGEEV